MLPKDKLEFGSFFQCKGLDGVVLCQEFLQFLTPVPPRVANSHQHRGGAHAGVRVGRDQVHSPPSLAGSL